MFKRNQEIWYSLIAMLAITVVYVFVYQLLGGLPAASGWFGHGIGVIGIVLMLTTEVAYSIRKQKADASWGSMASWLRFHMVTGIVGPYMVLLHTSMKFRGLAGVTMLLTIAVVTSGVVGRYFYTQVPRTLVTDGPGAALDAQVAQRIALERQALATWRTLHVPLTWVLFSLAFIHMLAALYYGTLQR